MGVDLLLHEALRKDLCKNSEYIEDGILRFNAVRLAAQNDKIKITLLKDSVELATIDKDILISQLQSGYTFTFFLYEGNIAVELR